MEYIMDSFGIIWSMILDFHGIPNILLVDTWGSLITGPWPIKRGNLRSLGLDYHKIRIIGDLRSPW